MKIKAFQCDPEWVDCDIYFDFEGWDDFIIADNLGNDDFCGFHTDYNLYDRLYRYCFDYDELQYAIEDAGHEYVSVPYYKNATEAIEDYLGFKPTKMQVHKIVETLNKPHDCSCAHYYGEDDRMAELLSICEKREWVSATIRGCSQGDWQTVIYPADDYSDDFVNYIESVYFNTGEEYAIATVEDDDTADSPLDCDDVYYNYYPSNVAWNEDLLKKTISDETGKDPKDIILYQHGTVISDVWKVA